MTVREKLQKIEIARKGNVVLLALNCPDDYAAMIMYDDIERHIRDGYVELQIVTGDAEVRSTDG